jgi:hypothetical protein
MVSSGGESTQLRPGQSEPPNRIQICLFDFASASSKPTDNFFLLLEPAALNIYSWMISSEVHLNWSHLCGHTTESTSVQPADDAVFMPSWFTPIPRELISNGAS